jgi:Tfp pilus assembly protein PilF
MGGECVSLPLAIDFTYTSVNRGAQASSFGRYSLLQYLPFPSRQIQNSLFAEVNIMLIALLINLAISMCQVWFVASPIQSRNTIDGRVTSSTGRPLSEMRVMLKSGSYSEVASALTDGSGRFRFMNLASGNYIVEVEPGATDYERQSARIAAIPFKESQGHGELFRVDIVMYPRRSSNTLLGTFSSANSVVFHQAVPDVAKKEYEQGVKNLEKGSFDSAFQSLKRAIELFPDYYDALERLGSEYVARDDAKSALPLLTHAVEINKDGWRAFYSLGIAQYKANRQSESVKSLQRAVELNPDSVHTNMWLGMVLAIDPAMRAAAIQSLEKASKMAKDPLPGQAYYYLGGLYIKNSQYKEAADAFETLLRVSPDVGDREKIKQMIGQLRQKAKEQNKK